MVNENYENALRHQDTFEENSRLALLLYILYVVLGVGGAILNNNGFPTLGPVLMVIGGVALILFIIALIKTFMSQVSFYKLLNQNKMSNILLLVVLGIPLYFVYAGFFNTKMKEDLKQIR